MTNRSAAGDITNYIESGEWKMMGVSVVNNIIYYRCCENPFPDVTFWVSNFMGQDNVGALLAGFRGDSPEN